MNFVQQCTFICGCNTTLLNFVSCSIRQSRQMTSAPCELISYPSHALWYHMMTHIYFLAQKMVQSWNVIKYSEFLIKSFRVNEQFFHYFTTWKMYFAQELSVYHECLLYLSVTVFLCVFVYWTIFQGTWRNVSGCKRWKARTRALKIRALVIRHKCLPSP